MTRKTVVSARGHYRIAVHGSWLLLIAACLYSVGNLSAADVVSTWNGTTGNWTDIARWSSNPLYPDNGNGGFTYDAVINGGSVTQDLAAGITIEKFTLNGGTIAGAYNLTVNDLLTWTSGTMSGSGTTYANGGLAISGSNIKYLNGTLNNAGTTTWSGTGHIYASGVFNNLLGAMFDMQDDLSLSYISTHGTFNNAGTFRKSAGAGNAWIDAVFNNTGTVEVQSGTLRLFGGGTSTGTFDVSPGATLFFFGGTYNLQSGSVVMGLGGVSFGSGTVNISGICVTPLVSVSGATLNLNAAAVLGTNSGMLTISSGSLNVSTDLSIPGTVNLSGGTLAGSGQVTVNNLTWSGGVMSGSGTTVIPSGGTLIIAIDASYGYRHFLARTLSNAGTVTMTGNGHFASAAGGIAPIIENQAGALFDLQGDVTFENWTPPSPPPVATFNNAGTFRKSGGTGAAWMGSNSHLWTFNNSGLVEVQSGTLRFLGPFNNTGTVLVQAGTLSAEYGGTSTGSFNTSPGGVLSFSGGTHDLTSSSMIAGDGSVNIIGGTVNAGPSVSIGAGTYSQTGALGMALAGTGAGQHATVDVAGTAALGGTLALSLDGGFSSVTGNTFQIFTFASRTGSFSNVTGTDLGGGLKLNLIYSPTDITILTAIPGDANLDSSVAFADYQLLEAGFGTGSTWAQGDFDGDGSVTFADYQFLEANFGKSVVPEPASLILLALGGLAFVRRRR